MANPENLVYSLLPQINHNPDVLSCLANLSNDEVFTPPAVANAMLDMLPQELFASPDTKFLDPVCKSGIFLREIVKRLMCGLEDKFPDQQKRLDHILHHQVYGIAITELTSLLCRRTLYCAKYPNCSLSISHFNNISGNIRYKSIQHTWKNGKCVFCGASQAQYEREDGLETHAYEFIHTANPQEIFGDMKFDVIIGNPPYQLSDGGNNASSKPIYHLFISNAKKLNPNYLTMITPSRWYSGGKGLDNFRDSMLKDKKISKIVDYQNGKDCFPGASIGGGVSYFLWSKAASQKCTISNVINGKVYSIDRELDEFDIFIRYNKAISIIRKVKKVNEETLTSVASSRNPYGLDTKTRGDMDNKVLKLYSSQGVSYVSHYSIKKGYDSIDKYKLMVSRTTSEHAGEPDKNGQFKVISKMIILNPSEVCTDSYIIIYPCNNYQHIKNLYKYMSSKFVRFLLLQAISSINLTRDRYEFVPMQDFSKSWTDAELYSKYNLSQEEIDFIESMIKPMDVAIELDNGTENA